MMIVVTVLSIAVIGLLIHSFVLYSKIKQGLPRPLSDEERMICERIIDAGIDNPWICRQAVETGKCTCLPCKKLERAKRDEIEVLATAK